LEPLHTKAKILLTIDFYNRKGNHVNFINWCLSVLRQNINIINFLKAAFPYKI
jgi:hypothetical protein